MQICKKTSHQVTFFSKMTRPKRHLSVGVHSFLVSLWRYPTPCLYSSDYNVFAPRRTTTTTDKRYSMAPVHKCATLLQVIVKLRRGKRRGMGDDRHTHVWPDGSKSLLLDNVEMGVDFATTREGKHCCVSPLGFQTRTRSCTTPAWFFPKPTKPNRSDASLHTFAPSTTAL